MCKHCGHPIGYHWVEGEECTVKDCQCPGYEPLEVERGAGTGDMKATFQKLNKGWNAEPNAPFPSVEIQGDDVLLQFYVNPFLFPDFREDEIGILRFVRCERYRLGSTNDHGWYLGQCRFSKLVPDWGEFYLVEGNAALLNSPKDWRSVGPQTGTERHFLFYFRDETFECVAEHCTIELSEVNSLIRTRKVLALPQ
jgi:hypothetical protein